MSTPENWFQSGEKLVTVNQYGTPEFTEGLELLKKSAEAGFTDAQVVLGHLYVQVHTLPDAASESAHWYQRATERGHPVAQDRLADLYMSGRGVPQNDAEAFRWYARTAAQAFPHALCNLAYMHDEGLGTPVDAGAATKMYLQAAASADPRGLFNLGLRYAANQDSPQQFPAAHACLAMAAFARYPLADELLARLDARLDPASREQAGVLAPRLRERLRAFQQRLESDSALTDDPPALMRFAEDNLAALGEPSLNIANVRNIARTAEPHQADAPSAISASPNIFIVDNFVSESECAHLLALAAARLAPARETTRERLSGEQTAFTGEAAIFNTPDSDAVVRNIERRIAAVFALPVTHVEPLSVLRYRADDRYAPHVDYFDAARLANNLRIGDRSGQRIASFLVYLRAPETGGETHYLKISKKIAGRPRMALCHFNLTGAGTPDPMTLHTGEAVVEGEKWLARTTLREKPFY
ncbi:MAG: 2OG-Fe(II) oxygenase [Gammaproteobacteria bacterium]